MANHVLQHMKHLVVSYQHQYLNVMKLIYHKHMQMQVMHQPIMPPRSKLGRSMVRSLNYKYLTVNNRRLISLFDIVLNAKNDSIAICTRGSRRLNKR